MSSKRNHIVVPNDPPKGAPLFIGVALLFLPPFGTFLGIYLLLKRGKAEFTRRKYNDYRHYAAIIGDRSSVSIRELANRLGKSTDMVMRDLQDMIDQNIIDPRAYIDRSALLLYLQDAVVETEFVNQTVNVYVNNPGQAKSAPIETEFVNASQPQAPKVELKKAAEPVKPKAKPKPAPVRKSAADTEEFEAKLREIRQLNEEIENEVVSERIDRIGALTASIFRVVREKPERADEVRKFMNYYLPTTLKLLKSYSLMEKQSYQGENIQASRKKIEDVLETLVHAFEQQQDKLFQSEALDVEADISVLETMMASDGLTEQGKGLRL